MKALWLGCAVAAAASFAWAEKNADLPTAAKQAVAKMDAAVLQAKKRAVAELTSAMNTESRAGRLDSAVAVSARIKAINTEIDALENKPASGSGEDIVPGAWRMQNGVLYTFEKNKTFSASGGNFKWQGKWRVEDGKLLVDSTLFVDTYNLPAQKEVFGDQAVWTFKGKNSKGEAVSLHKQE